MEKKPPATAATAPRYANSDGGGSTNEIAAVLLGLLRNVDRQVATSLELSPEAQAAVAHFRALSAALNVEPATFGNSIGLAGRARP
jgi:hypothetical protein